MGARLRKSGREGQQKETARSEDMMDILVRDAADGALLRLRIAAQLFFARHLQQPLYAEHARKGESLL